MQGGLYATESSCEPPHEYRLNSVITYTVKRFKDKLSVFSHYCKPQEEYMLEIHIPGHCLNLDGGIKALHMFGVLQSICGIYSGLASYI